MVRAAALVVWGLAVAPVTPAAPFVVRWPSVIMLPVTAVAKAKVDPDPDSTGLNRLWQPGEHCQQREYEQEKPHLIYPLPSPKSKSDELDVIYHKTGKMSSHLSII
jgi:hypothetical protein